MSWTSNMLLEVKMIQQCKESLGCRILFRFNMNVEVADNKARQLSHFGGLGQHKVDKLYTHTAAATGPIGAAAAPSAGA